MTDDENTLDAATSTARPLRVLCVDDNRDATTTLKLLLSALGYESHAAHDGLEAVEAAERLRPDVALVDLSLPTLDGHEVCRRIREQPWGRGVLLLALTGWDEEDARVKSAAVGFDHFMVKPVDVAALSQLLSRLRPAS